MSVCRHGLAAVALCLCLAFVAPAFAADPPAAEVPSPFADVPQFTPAPEPAAPPCHGCGGNFTSSPGGGAPSHWGHGSTCTGAQNDVRAQLQAYANAFCFDLDPDTLGRCAFSVVYTCTCYQQGGQFVVDAYANFGCWFYIC